MPRGLQRNKHQLERCTKQETPQNLFAHQNHAAHRHQLGEHDVIVQHGGYQNGKPQRGANFNAARKRLLIENRAEMQNR